MSRSFQPQSFELVGAFSPLARHIGFLHASFADVVRFCDNWISPKRGAPVEIFVGSIENALSRLTPLREKQVLLNCCPDDWTAIFIDRTDPPESEVGYISRTMKCRGVIATYGEDSYNTKTDEGDLGAIQLRIFEPFKTYFLNYGRSISLINEGDRWRFDEGGDPLPFEDLSKYRAACVRDRFDVSTLIKYCNALGVDPYDRSFYGERWALYGPRPDSLAD